MAANFVNDGEAEANFEAALRINGTVEQTRLVAIGPHSSALVRFNVTKAQPGTYTVQVGDKQDSFTILGSGSGTSGTPAPGAMMAILLLLVLILATAVVLVLSFRRA